MRSISPNLLGMVACLNHLDVVADALLMQDLGQVQGRICEDAKKGAAFHLKLAILCPMGLPPLIKPFPMIITALINHLSNTLTLNPATDWVE